MFPSEGGHLETTSDDEIRGRPRSPSYYKPVINILDIQTRTESTRNRPSFKKRLNNEIDVSPNFFYFGQQNLPTSFSRMADHSYNLEKSRGNLSKGGYRITGNGKVLVD